MTKSELCLMCMACCKVLSFEIPVHPETLDFYGSRGVKIIYTDVTPLKAIVVIPHVCSKLTSTGCSIYKTRPLSCQVFNGRKSPAVKDVCLWPKED